jgi:hypothetical protein
MSEILNGIPKFSHAFKEPALSHLYKGWSHLEFFKGQVCFEFLIDSKGEIRYTSYLAKYWLHKTRQKLLDYIQGKFEVKETICQ